ncbi:MULTISPECIES: hypothetical protein [Yersinia pseudotuberculosis complex]|uniref:hypothetical protein n=1 Tax=Yersinia pseudotuberculosis complex TaxID=1649845 RepID=UPI00061CAD0A|nr:MULTISPECIES: hypothetical protein [Yersinia pseudotuberculosis complex]CNB08954.1 Uncharacterised protein [Yersinia similis]
MLRRTQKRNERAYITLPDGRTGTIHTDRRCDVIYDLPADVHISNRPPLSVLKKEMQP